MITLISFIVANAMHLDISRTVPQKTVSDQNCNYATLLLLYLKRLSGFFRIWFALRPTSWSPGRRGRCAWPFPSRRSSGSISQKNLNRFSEENGAKVQVPFIFISNMGTSLNEVIGDEEKLYWVEKLMYTISKGRLESLRCKDMHLKQKLVISVPFVILNFGTSL